MGNGEWSTTQVYGAQPPLAAAQQQPLVAIPLGYVGALDGAARWQMDENSGEGAEFLQVCCCSSV